MTKQELQQQLEAVMLQQDIKRKVLSLQSMISVTKKHPTMSEIERNERIADYQQQIIDLRTGKTKPIFKQQGFSGYTLESVQTKIDELNKQLTKLYAIKEQLQNQ